VERVRLLLAVCKEAATRMPDREAVGRWMLTHQPSLDGDSPADAVLRHRTAAYDLLLSAIHATSPAAELEPRSSEFWTAFEAGLPEATAARARAARERAQREPDVGRRRTLV
jgi:hypothetical protein